MAFPYTPAFSRLLRSWSPWSTASLKTSIAATFATALLGAVLLNFFRWKPSLLGGLIGMAVSIGLIAVFQHNAKPAFSDELLEAVTWNTIAGTITGGLWKRLVSANGPFVLKPTDTQWFAAFFWIAVYRITQIVVAFGTIRKDALFAEELLCIVPILSLSRLAVKLLIKKARSGVRQYVLVSILCGVFVQETAALILSPLAFLSRGAGGTQEALDLLVFPIPGILWGIAMGTLLSRLQRYQLKQN